MQDESAEAWKEADCRGLHCQATEMGWSRGQSRGEGSQVLAGGVQEGLGLGWKGYVCLWVGAEASGGACGGRRFGT